MTPSILNRLNILIKKAYYTHERYKLPATFALMYHHKALEPIELGQYVRKSDLFIPIDENHYFINFASTEQSAAFKACQNLIFSLDKHFEDTDTIIAVDTFDASKSPNIVFNRLQQILKETKKDPYSRIEDENILNGII